MYFTPEQTETIIKTISKFIAGYDFNETHGEQFKVWAEEADLMGFGKEFEIPLTLYGDKVLFKVDDDEMCFETKEREFISSRRFAQRWLDAHKALVDIATAMGRVVSAQELAVDPESHGPEIRMGQKWCMKGKEIPILEVVEGASKHIMMRSEESGKVRPVQDRFLADEYELRKDSPDGEIITYGSKRIIDNETKVASVDDVNDSIEAT